MRCLNCFKEFDESMGLCPHCGVAEVVMREPIDLAPGTILQNRYLIGESVGAGGFGIIYKAWDMKLESVVAVKEYYPTRLVTRAMGTTNLIVTTKGKEEYDYRKARFLAEARNMAKFGSHRNVANVFDYFEENNTAYIVMELLTGTPLNQYVKENDTTVDPDFAIYVTNEVGKALISLHKAGIIHRDVAPDNIYICDDKEMKVKLLDLGAAKLADEDEDVIDIVLKPGYSPIEQYVEDESKRINIDERSDLYALAATLYLMVTGVKPEESTNRRITDNVEAANTLNDKVSENLSNSIMKGIAVDKHLRFKTIQDFLDAINGERKVIPLDLEKKRRKIKQIVGVVAALIVVLGAAAALFGFYQNKKSQNELKPALISVWYCAEEGSGEQIAMESIKLDFETSFEGVVVDLHRYSPEEYDAALVTAANSGTLPNLFESTNVSSSVVDSCLPLTNVAKSSQAADCAFLANYAEVYPDMKQIPLGIEIPNACVIINGNTCIDYPDNFFTSISDFPATANVSADTYAFDLNMINYNFSNLAEEGEFLNPTDNTSAVMLTSTMNIDAVRQYVSGYSYKFVYPKMDQITCQYIYEWSIGGGSKEQVKASERLLSWMLGNKYQNELMVSYGTDGQFPVCTETFLYKTETMEYYAPIKDIYTKFNFVQYTTD